MYKYNPNNMIFIIPTKILLLFVVVFTKVYKTNNSLYLQPNTVKSAQSMMKNRL